MIVRNEEKYLENCLKSVVELVDEIIIVDTGSIDSTKTIALKYTDKVYKFLWCNDFSAARNYSISKAGHEYILVIDGDEKLEEMNRSELEALIEENPQGVGRLLRINKYTRKNQEYRNRERVGRLFSKEYYRYEGRIHEQLSRFKKTEKVEDGIIYYNIPLVFEHLGYEGELTIRKEKTQRNIRLLEEECKQRPLDPYLLYQLGKSYYMEEDYKKACEYFEQVLSIDLNQKLEYVEDLVESYGYSLLNTDQYGTALQLWNLYEDFNSSSDFVFLMGLILMNNGKFQEAIDVFKKATDMPDCKVEGVNGYLAFYNMAVIHECLGHQDEAFKYYKKCGNYQPALRKLGDMVE